MSEYFLTAMRQLWERKRQFNVIQRDSTRRRALPMPLATLGRVHPMDATLRDLHVSLSPKIAAINRTRREEPPADLVSGDLLLTFDLDIAIGEVFTFVLTNRALLAHSP